ncbi:MAG TPA: BamA/TamA family outer membrane protein [Polyangiaceae bacterium]
MAIWRARALLTALVIACVFFWVGTCFGADDARTSHAGTNANAEPDETSRTPSKTDAPSNVDSDDAHDYETPHYEPAGFPLLGGDSDIGFEFGVVGTLSHFANGVVPYQWNMDVVLALSLKSGPHGDEITQQSYQWNIDVPQVFGGRVRLNPQLLYYRTVNQLYFGVGNASSPNAPAGASPRYFEFDDRQARFRELTRVTLQGPVDLMFGTIYRFEDPHPYDGSKLASDAAAGAIRGVDPASLFTLAAGIVYDTRDSEIFPRRGSYHHIGLRGTYGLPTSSGIGYGGAGARISTYLPLGGPAILALRGVADLEFGNVPVYDLYTGGVFLTDEMIGGSSSVRGVPDGRYSGLIKVFGNAEVRALLVRFHLFDQEFHLGGNLLFDTGRLWSDYTFHARADGSGIGLKWGAGAGGYLQWGQAAVFRLEVAYSPDAASENPSLPLGIYVEDGVMF